MKIFAHVRLDGSIEALVALPDGDLTAMRVPSPGVQVCEIVDHGITGDVIEIEQLRKLRESYTIDIAPATGKLVPKKNTAK